MSTTIVCFVLISKWRKSKWKISVTLEKEKSAVQADKKLSDTWLVKKKRSNYGRVRVWFAKFHIGEDIELFSVAGKR